MERFLLCEADLPDCVFKVQQLVGHLSVGDYLQIQVPDEAWLPDIRRAARSDRWRTLRFEKPFKLTRIVARHELALRTYVYNYPVVVGWRQPLTVVAKKGTTT